jgi:hypothetical protein
MFTPVAITGRNNTYILVKGRGSVHDIFLDNDGFAEYGPEHVNTLYPLSHGSGAGFVCRKPA